MANSYYERVAAFFSRTAAKAIDVKNELDAISAAFGLLPKPRNDSLGFDAKLKILDGTDPDHAVTLNQLAGTEAATELNKTGAQEAQSKAEEAQALSESAKDDSVSAKSNAESSAQSAAVSESAAISAKNNANSSASSASTSESNAETFASNASSSASSASSSALDAATSQTSANNSKNSAATSASNASTSETNAAQSAAAAALFDPSSYYQKTVVDTALAGKENADNTIIKEADIGTKVLAPNGDASALTNFANATSSTTGGLKVRLNGTTAYFTTDGSDA
jgi:hypothetical protein